MSIREQNARLKASITNLVQMPEADLDAVVEFGAEAPLECRQQFADCEKATVSDMGIGEMFFLPVLHVSNGQGGFDVPAEVEDYHNDTFPVSVAKRIANGTRALLNVGEPEEDCVFELYKNLDSAHSGISEGYIFNVRGDLMVIKLSVSEVNILSAEVADEQGKLGQAGAAQPLKEALDATNKGTDVGPSPSILRASR